MTKRASRGHTSAQVKREYIGVVRNSFLKMFGLKELVSTGPMRKDVILVKNPPANARDTGLIPGLERSPGEGNGNPCLYSCLENSMDRRTWRAAVMGSQKVRHD